MIIFGWGYKTYKRFGFIQLNNCIYCNNSSSVELLKVTTWFTLFFIPVIPITRRYLLMCNRCKGIQEIDKETFLQYINGENKVEVFEEANIPDSNINQYTNKTSTQINYLKEMEAIRREKENMEKNI